ncbi:beta-lactamase/transpeptidase-like protein [Pseudohyphozyma bogoriensis]|nr:beta-lactamase/transpeptidase-like protein [Pseudohyphozyma bogoriensis]
MSLQTRLEALLSSAVATGTAPGLVATVFTRDCVIAEAGAGVKDFKSEELLTTSTPIALASMSKPVVSLAVLRAVEQQIGRYYKKFKCRMDIDKVDRISQYEPFGSRPLSMTGRLEAIEIPRVFEAGEGWMYGHSAAWAGIFLERLTGLHLRAALQELVLTPLGLTAPSHTLDTYISPEMEAEHATLHIKTGERRFKVMGFVEDGSRWEGEPPEGRHVFADAPLRGSILLYTKFLQSLLNRSAPSPDALPLISRKLWDEATKDALAPMGLSLPKPVLKSCNPIMTGDMEVFSMPREGGAEEGWTLLQTYYFVDVEANVGAVLAAQFLPWADTGIYELRDRMEELIYECREEWA